MQQTSTRHYTQAQQTTSYNPRTTDHQSMIKQKTFHPYCKAKPTIARTKNGKCPGEDGIHNEYLKMGSDFLIPTITNLFNQILETEEIPTEWKQSTIILLHKKRPKGRQQLQTNQLVIKPIQTVHADHNEENVQDTRQEPTSRTGRL
jgi:hypothetical protein